MPWNTRILAAFLWSNTNISSCQLFLNFEETESRRFSLEAAPTDKYPRSSQEFQFILSPQQYCQGKCQTSHLEKPEGHLSSCRRWAVYVFFLPPWILVADCPKMLIGDFSFNFFSPVTRVSFCRSEDGIRRLEPAVLGENSLSDLCLTCPSSKTEVKPLPCQGLWNTLLPCLMVLFKDKSLWIHTTYISTIKISYDRCPLVLDCFTGILE